MKKVEDHPIEDFFGDEICPNDVYWEFGNDIVLDSNLKTYLMEQQHVECIKAI